jgi:hypothetical protein
MLAATLVLLLLGSVRDSMIPLVAHANTKISVFVVELKLRSVIHIGGKTE